MLMSKDGGPSRQSVPSNLEEEVLLLKEGMSAGSYHSPIAKSRAGNRVTIYWEPTGCQSMLGAFTCAISALVLVTTLDRGVVWINRDVNK